MKPYSLLGHFQQCGQHVLEDVVGICTGDVQGLRAADRVEQCVGAAQRHFGALAKPDVVDQHEHGEAQGEHHGHRRPDGASMLVVERGWLADDEASCGKIRLVDAVALHSAVVVDMGDRRLLNRNAPCVLAVEDAHCHLRGGPTDLGAVLDLAAEGQAALDAMARDVEQRCRRCGADPLDDFRRAVPLARGVMSRGQHEDDVFRRQCGGAGDDLFEFEVVVDPDRDVRLQGAEGVAGMVETRAGIGTVRIHHHLSGPGAHALRCLHGRGNVDPLHHAGDRDPGSDPARVEGGCVAEDDRRAGEQRCVMADGKGKGCVVRGDHQVKTL
jgi:hypothetical protein